MCSVDIMQVNDDANPSFVGNLELRVQKQYAKHTNWTNASKSH